MKFSKIASAAAAIAAAGMMTVSASALLVPVKDKAEKLHDSTGASWMVVPFFDGESKADAGKPVGTIEGLDFSKIAKLSVTFSVFEDERAFWDGNVGGALILSMNGGDIVKDSDDYKKYNWASQDFWGVTDEALNITSDDGSHTLSAVKVGDYTYKVTSNAFDNPLANGTASKIGLCQIAVNDWASSAMAQVQVDKLEVLDASDNVLITFDGKGNYTLAGGGDSTPSGSDTTPSGGDATPSGGDTTSTPNNVDTGVEGVAAVVGVAALAAGTIVLSKKRK